jgi:hypothetical protein
MKDCDNCEEHICSEACRESHSREEEYAPILERLEEVMKNPTTWCYDRECPWSPMSCVQCSVFYVQTGRMMTREEAHENLQDKE